MQTLDSSLGFRTGFVPAASGSYFHISVGQRDADGVKLLERGSSRNAAAAFTTISLKNNHVPLKAPLYDTYSVCRFVFGSWV